jgi:hypothetical protein
MKNEQTHFDKALREKLNDLEMPFDPDSWDRMEAALEEEEDAAAREFDRVAAEKLRRMEQPYDPHSWDLMARRIDEAFSIRHWLHRYHVPELALMILLVVTLVQYLNMGESSERIDPLAPQALAESRGAAVPIHSPKKPVAEVLPPAVATADQRPEGLSPVALLPSSGLKSVPAKAASPVLSPSRMERLPSLHVLPEQGSKPNLEQFARGSALATLDVFKTFVKRPSRWYAGMYGAADLNLIYSPMDEEFGTGGYLTDSTGLRAGLFFSMERRKWALRSGVAYAKIAYRPQLPVQQYGTFDYLVIESFEGIQYQFLQVPLEVRRGFLSDQSKWDLYLLAGIEANLISNATYDIRQEEIFSSRSSLSTADREAVAEKSRLNQKHFPKGVFNGDRFFSNVYLSFSTGFGLERALSHRSQLFVEPVYSRPFFGHDIGPNEDRIHQFSLRMGAKVRIR